MNEMDRISDSLIRFLIIHKDECYGKPEWEVYNMWTRCAGIGDISPEALKWAVGYIGRTDTGNLPEAVSLLPELLNDLYRKGE